MSGFDVEQYTIKIDAFLWPERDDKLRRKRERILGAATELFARLGYRKTSVDEIAKAAGVAKGTVYLYYSNKAELVLHALALEERSHLARLAPFGGGMLSPRAKLSAVIALSIYMSREMPLTRSLIQGDHEIELALEELDEEVYSSIMNQQLAIVVELLDAATDQTMEPLELRARAMALVELTFAVVTSDRTNAHGLPWAEYAVLVAEVIVGGVVKQSATSEDILPLVRGYDGAEKDRRISWGS